VGGYQSIRSKAYKSSNRLVFSRALFCLFAIAAQVFLPIAHTYQLDAEEVSDRLESGIASTCAHGLSDSGHAIGGPQKPSHHQHHDPSTCPICQLLFKPNETLILDNCAGSVILDPVDLPSSNLHQLYVRCRPRSPPYPMCLSLS
jgi:hypothetical protein